MSAFVRTDTPGTAAGIALRIDTPPGAGKATPTIVSTIDHQPLRGKTDWTPLQLVIDVPNDATQLAIALILRGGGAAWIDDAKFEIVDKSVPLTQPALAPDNLGFEE
jgi:hypothetical protein